MFYRKPFILLFAVLFSIGIVACTDTGVAPESTTTTENAFTDGEALRGFLGKLYAGLAVTGQEGPTGDSDLTQVDEGFGQYIRLWWKLQQFPTDETVNAWGDPGIPELSTQEWSPDNQFVTAMYRRIFFQIAQANEFLRQTTEEQLEAKGIRADVRQRVLQWRAEARFLRALSYWHGLDLFGKLPLVEEDDPIGAGEGGTAPEMSSAENVFDFIESELRAISDSEGEENLAPVGAAEYGRANRAAAWMLASKLFLNADVYVGQARNDDAVEFSNRVINAFGASGSVLEPDYHDLFLADNHTAQGIIFPVPNDGERQQSFGNTTFLANAATGDFAGSFGVSGWFGNRTTPTSVARYEDDPDDTRPKFENMPDTNTQFLREEREREVTARDAFTQGFGVPKYQNVTSDGEPGQDNTFADTDYPMFRLAEAYLTYAEARLRGGSGGDFDPLTLVNLLRDRAGASEVSSLSLNFILDERSRELFWEGTRRTDLRRFGLFTGDELLWAFKGGVQEGQAPNSRVDLYPIPEAEITANPNITQENQNPGY